MSNNTMKTHVTTPSDCEVLITRTFDAPRSRIWAMWTQAEHLKHWWGPKGWTLPVCEVDFREGGTWFYCMQGPDDMTSCGLTDYVKIDEPHSIVMRDKFVDENGQEMEGMPVATSTVEFHEKDGKTTVINKTIYPTKADRDAVIEMGMAYGIDETFNRLEAYLAQ